MASLVAIDPGDVYVGVAFFNTDADDWTKADNGDWYCADVQELEPNVFIDAFAESLFDNDFDVVVFERFRLYSDKSVEQTGSEFLTAQLIGIIKYLVRVRNEHVQRHKDAETHGWMMTCEIQGGSCVDPAKRPRPVTIIGQMADIKKPTAGILRHRKIKSVAKPISREQYGGRDHVVDAELHGWRYILHGRHNG